MKKFLVSIMLLSSFAHAESLELSVKNFNFNYKDPHGEGTASSFTRNKLNEAVTVQVDRLDKDFKFLVSGAENGEFEFKNAPSFMTDAETMSITGFNLNLSSGLTLSMSAGRFESRSGSLKLDGLAVECARNAGQKDILDQLLTGCIQKMSFKTNKFQSQSDGDGLVEILNTTLETALADKSAVTINSINMNISSGKYDLSADVKAQISGKVRSSGNLSYDSVKGLLTVKISEVKFGILNLTGKVFDELKKKENDKLKVKQPYVYYSLK